MDPLSGQPHYPYPPAPIKGQQTVNPRRRLAPLVKPSKLAPLPDPLPRNLDRKCAFTPTHSLSVHILPAAFPRAPTPPEQIQIPLPDSFKSKEDRTKWLITTQQRLMWEKNEAEKGIPDPRVGLQTNEEGLWSTVLRIRRNESTIKEGGNSKGITLVAAHAIGFHKEVHI